MGGGVLINSNSVIECIEDSCGDVFDPSVSASILALEDKIRELEPVNMEANSLFSGNIYAREIHIPAGTVMTGRVYLVDHIDVMVCGDMTVTSDEGTKRITGFNVFPSKAGKKRAGFAHENTRWITFCACEEATEDYYFSHLTTENLADYEQNLIKRLIVDERVIVEAHCNIPHACDYNAFKLGYLSAKGKLLKEEADLMDFELMAREIGVDESVILSETLIDDDLITDCPDGVYVAVSTIEGQGLFTQNTYSQGDEIMMGRIDGRRTIAGRYTNHSILPNSGFIMKGSDVCIVALRDISREEITIDYRESYRLRGL